ncbi:MAG: hypothetical protein DRP82_02480 [Planctomycetota bacterium]|nr:MAG: hypothetical protein DRP82_02480 [Planctomycetota bacterium]
MMRFLFVLFFITAVVGCRDPIPVLRIVSTKDNMDGTLTVKYKLRTIDGSSCSLEVTCYEPNLGWMPATSGGGDGTSNLSSKDDWVEHTFIWKYAEDLGPGVHTGVKIRLTPYTETEKGKSRTAGPMTVGTPFVVATLTEKDSLAFIDPNTKKVVQTVQTGDSPSAVAVSPDGSTIAVCNKNDASVTLVSADGLFIGQIGVGTTPSSCAFHPTQPLLFVTCYDDANLFVLDLSTMTVADQIPVDAGPTDVVVTPAGNAAVVACEDAGTIVVVDTDTYATVSIAQSNAPTALAVTPDGNTLVVVSKDADVLLVFNTSNLQTPTTTLAVGLQPCDVATTPDGKYAVCTNSGSNSVSIVNLQSLTVSGTVGVGESPVAVSVSHDGAFAYVACCDSNRVDKVDIEAGNCSANYSTGTATAPQGVVALPR